MDAVGQGNMIPQHIVLVKGDINVCMKTNYPHEYHKHSLEADSSHYRKQPFLQLGNK